MNISKNIILLIGIGVILAVLLLGLWKWEYMWEGEFLSKWASIVTMTSLGLSPAIYFLKKWMDSRDERFRASKNLHIELNDALNVLNEKRHNNLKGVKLPDGKEILFINRMFNHDFYDSMIFSGKINFLSPNIQQFIQNTFQKIKAHNEYLRKIREIENDVLEDEDSFKKTIQYYVLLEKTEKELLFNISNAQKKLEG